jgi:hypothetical protein
VRNSVDAIRASYGDEWAAANALGAIKGAPAQPATVRAAVVAALLNDPSPKVQAVAQAALKTDQEAAVDRQLKGFQQGVSNLAKQSPTLRDEVYRADLRGYHFVNVTADQSMNTNHTDQLVFVGSQGLSDSTITRRLAHEASHSANDAPSIAPTVGMTEQQYVAKGIDLRLHDEGRAELNSVKARMEILDAGGHDIGRPRPPETDIYQAIYNDYKANHITWDQAVDQAAGEIRTETPSAFPTGNYEDMYRKEFTDQWTAWQKSH